MTKEFIERLKNLKKICHHFHLSLQSGSTSVLKRMNRRYTAEDFKETVRNIRENFENVILTADIIVGFPGETEEEFEQTINFLKEIKFYKIHVFKYSIREGTKAASFPNQVLPEIKDKRSKKIIELSDDFQNEYNKKYIGKVFKILVEEKVGDFYIGHSENYLKGTFRDGAEKSHLENKIVDVFVESAEKEVLNCKLM